MSLDRRAKTSPTVPEDQWINESKQQLMAPLDSSKAKERTDIKTVFRAPIQQMHSELAQKLLSVSNIFGYSGEKPKLRSMISNIFGYRSEPIPPNFSPLLLDINRYFGVYNSITFGSLEATDSDTQKSPFTPLGSDFLKKTLEKAQKENSTAEPTLNDVFKKSATKLGELGSITLELMKKYDEHKNKPIAVLLKENPDNILSIIGQLAIVSEGLNNLQIQNLDYSQAMGRCTELILKDYLLILNQDNKAYAGDLTFNFSTSTADDTYIRYDKLDTRNTLVSSRTKYSIKINKKLEESFGLEAGDLQLDFYALEKFSYDPKTKRCTWIEPDKITIESDVPEITALVSDLFNTHPPEFSADTLEKEILLRTLFANVKKFDRLIDKTNDPTVKKQLTAKRDKIAAKYNELCTQYGYSNCQIPSSHLVTAKPSTFPKSTTTSSLINTVTSSIIKQNKFLIFIISTITKSFAALTKLKEKILKPQLPNVSSINLKPIYPPIPLPFGNKHSATPTSKTSSDSRAPKPTKQRTTDARNSKRRPPESGPTPSNTSIN
jgi:hypothetical protein